MQRLVPVTRVLTSLALAAVLVWLSADWSDDDDVSGVDVAPDSGS
jgi:hypothetical protein